MPQVLVIQLGTLLTFNASTAELVGRVVSIADGDTLTVLVDRKQVKVRLADIYAPERKQPYGTRSRQSLAELCQQKRATIVSRDKDGYGRTVGYVNCAGVDANAERVRRGMAWVLIATHGQTRRCTFCRKRLGALAADCGDTAERCHLGSGVADTFDGLVKTAKRSGHSVAVVQRLQKKTGRRLKARRLELRLSRERVAKACKLSPSYLSQLGAGLRNLTIDVLYRLDNVLGVKLDELLR